MELDVKTKNKEAFSEVITSILREKAVFSVLEPKYTLKIRDPNCLTVKEDVEDAVKRDIPDLGEIKVGFTPENSRRQRIAIADLREKAAEKRLEQGRIKFGWVNCRVSYGTSVL